MGDQGRRRRTDCEVPQNLKRGIYARWAWWLGIGFYLDWGQSCSFRNLSFLAPLWRLATMIHESVFHSTFLR